MKTKILLWGVVSILIIGLAGGAFWWLRRPQVITLDNGDKLTLLAVDYGKRHTPPASKTPAPAAGARNRRGGGAFTSQNNQLCIWLRRDYASNQYPNYQFYLYDKAGTACVGDAGRNGGYGGGQQQKGSEIMGVRFDAFPRRQAKFVVRVQEYIQNAGQVMNEKRFVISNPARSRSFPDWTAETLPVTKTDGDLSVTLTKLVFGADSNFNRDQDNPDDAINKGVQATFHVERNGKSVANWQPASVETSDATGNHVNGWCNNTQTQDNDITTAYQFGLWPDERAWKIKFEFSQQSGFSDSELWVVKNIPLQPGRQQDFWNYSAVRNRTNSPFAETDLNGVHLKIFRAKQFTDISPDSQPQGGFEILASPSPSNGLQMKLVQITDDQTNDLESWNSNTSGNGNTTDYRYGVRNLDGVTNLNVTIALPRSHFFEFTVNPEKQ